MNENVYISGPMTGYIEHNYPTFNAAAAILREQGFTVLNPAEHFGGDHDRKRSEYLRADVKDILQNATAVCLLPGWETSPGAILEVALAYNIGILSYLEVDFIERRAVWVGYMDHVVNHLPEQVLPAKAPDTMAPEGELQPTWWKYQDSILDPTGRGFRIEGQAVPEEDALTKATLDEAPVPLFDEQVCRVCFHDEHGNTEETSCQELDIMPPAMPPFRPCGCTEYVDLEAESRITIPDPYNDDFAEGPEPKETVLEEAQRIVLGPRQSSYSHPAQDFRATGRQWAALVENWLLAEYPGVLRDDVMPDIEPRIVALMMAALKASREAHKPKRDNRVDGPGYWFCAERIVESF